MALDEGLLAFLLEHVNVFKPRFFLSEGHFRCREEVINPITSNKVIMIRLNVENFGWKQDDPPPCEVYLNKISHAVGSASYKIPHDPCRLSWKDDDGFGGLKITKNRLINICSVENIANPKIVVWSEEGRKGYSIDRGAGIYTFELATVCKGASQGSTELYVSFDPNNWESINIVSNKSKPKWRSWAGTLCWLLGVFALVAGILNVAS